MDDITVITSGTGKYRAQKTYNNIVISCPNEGAAVTDTSRNIIRLIVAAVNLNWFRADATQIGVLGTAHNTTKNDKGETVPDAKHLTVTIKPGGKAKHLYLLPNEDTKTVTASNTLDTDRPPANP